MRGVLKDSLYSAYSKLNARHDDQVDATSQALAWIQESRRTMLFSYDFG